MTALAPAGGRARRVCRAWSRSARLCVLYAGAVAALASVACPLDKPAVQKGELQASWVPDPASLSVGRLFSIDVQLCPRTASLLRVDATMPEHRHGMNYRPSLKPLGDGRWRAEGLMFHMPGRWELRLDVQSASATERLIDTVLLP